MTTTHTLGPWWIAAQSDLELSYIVGAGDNEHGLIYGKPNALLVKAAPDLLEACDLVQRAWVGDGVTMAEAVDAVLLAMSKVQP